MAKKLEITRKSGLKGDDGYKVFSIRIKDEIYGQLEKLAAETNRSRNEIIGMMLEFAVENCEIKDPESSSKYISILCFFFRINKK